MGFFFRRLSKELDVKLLILGNYLATASFLVNKPQIVLNHLLIGYINNTKTIKMKTQIKDIVIGIFAVIGFIAVVMGFTNETAPQQNCGTPESHVYEMITINVGGSYGAIYKINKRTGETSTVMTVR